MSENKQEQNVNEMILETKKTVENIVDWIKMLKTIKHRIWDIYNVIMRGDMVLEYDNFIEQMPKVDKAIDAMSTKLTKLYIYLNGVLDAFEVVENEKHRH